MIKCIGNMVIFGPHYGLRPFFCALGGKENDLNQPSLNLPSFSWHTRKLSQPAPGGRQVGEGRGNNFVSRAVARILLAYLARTCARALFPPLILSGRKQYPTPPTDTSATATPSAPPSVFPNPSHPLLHWLCHAVTPPRYQISRGSRVLRKRGGGAQQSTTARLGGCCSRVGRVPLVSAPGGGTRGT